jgi:hypothetical protein
LACGLLTVLVFERNANFNLLYTKKLVNMFFDNFSKYLPFIDDDVKAAAIG